MLLDSDPANGSLGSLLFDPASLMILSLTLFFCLHSRVDKVIRVLSMVSYILSTGVGMTLKKAKIRVNFTNLASSNF